MNHDGMSDENWPYLFEPYGLPVTHSKIPCHFRPRDAIPSFTETCSSISGNYCIERLATALSPSKIYGFSHQYPYLIFGRNPLTSHCFIGHDSVAPQHAVIYWGVRGEVSKCCLQNLPTPTGTRVNGKLLEADADVALGLNSKIQLGKVAEKLVFRRRRPGDNIMFPMPAGVGESVQDAPFVVTQAVPITDCPPPQLLFPVSSRGMDNFEGNRRG